MLNVTEAARECLRTRLHKANAELTTALRFQRRKNRWTLQLDSKRPDDTCVMHKGRNVLLMSAEVAEAMESLTLDAKNIKAGTGLKLRRNKSSCG
ncbi:MAG TPA: hypothetical protein PKN33_13875 [Phycisphaerae bacterium]|nr:hypothetical protein [Phycisphaerales bacterium]HNO79135.1 hypothetical protein [Phycisphaerae bacterium]